MMKKSIRLGMSIALCCIMLMSTVGIANATAVTGTYVPNWKDLGLAKDTAVQISRQDVLLNGEKLVWDEAVYGECFVISNRIYVPMRVIADKLGAGDTVKWDGNTSTASVMTPNGEMTMQNQKKYVTLNGEKKESADSYAVLMFNGRTYTAIRLFIENGWSDLKIDWRPGVVNLDGVVKPPAETANGIATIIAYEDFDPTKLEKTAAMGDNIAKNWPRDSSAGLTKDGRKIGLLLQQSNGVYAQLYATHNGSGVAIMGGPFSEPLSWPETSKWIDAFYSETVNDNLRTNAMKVLNDLAARYAAGEKTNENVTAWFEENLYNHGYPIGDGYVICFNSSGIMISSADEFPAETIRSEFPWFNK